MTYAPAVSRCPSCGAAVSESAAHCIACGAQVRERRVRDRAAPSLPPDAGPEFAGLSGVGSGRRLVAWSIDVAAAALAGGVAWLATSAPACGVLVAVEALALTWGLMVRTGASLGQRIAGVWITRENEPITVGLGRGLGRAGVMVGGLALALVGAWAVAGALDRSGRGLADRLTRSRQVRRAEGAAIAADAGARFPRHGEPVVVEHAVTEQAAAVQATTEQATAEQLVSAQATAEQLVSAQATVQSESEWEAPTSSVLEYEAPDERALEAALAEWSAKDSDASPVAVEPEATCLVLEFDTGQRVELAVPGWGFMGRDPVADEAGCQLVRVNDPDQSVSRVHVRFECTPSGLIVADQGSTNGSAVMTQADGTTIELTAGVEAQAPVGSRVRLGERWFSVGVR